MCLSLIIDSIFKEEKLKQWTLRHSYWHKMQVNISRFNSRIFNMEAEIILGEPSHLHFPLLTYTWSLCTFIAFGGKFVSFPININSYLLYKVTLNFFIVHVTCLAIYQWILKLGLKIRTFFKSVLQGLLENVPTFNSRWLAGRVMVAQTFYKLFFTDAL